jgi:hypothetical protein
MVYAEINLSFPEDYHIVSHRLPDSPDSSNNHPHRGEPAHPTGKEHRSDRIGNGARFGRNCDTDTRSIPPVFVLFVHKDLIGIFGTSDFRKLVSFPTEDLLDPLVKDDSKW